MKAIINMGTEYMLLLSKYLMAGVVFYYINKRDLREGTTGLFKNKAA